VDQSYKIDCRQSVARALVEIDTSKGLFESLDIIFGKKVYTQILDYSNMSFISICHHQHDYLV
jgi:hypothetical protein